MPVVARDTIPDAGDRAGPDADFDSLRSLLIGPERRQIQDLQARLDDPIARGRDLARVLPLALRARHGDDDLTAALLPPVESAIGTSVRRNPGPLADALFPVMGPAIRKAVAASLASMMESVNRTIEHGFSAQSWRWRLIAWRTGRPFAEIVLLNTLLYRVEQIFLIDRRSGLLLQQVRGAGASGQDADLVSGMLTAIRDFVGDSFRVAEGDTLDSLEVGDLSVVIEQGPQALLAAVVRGTPPPDFRQTLQQALEAVHLQQGDALAAFRGDAIPFEASRPVLEDCVQAEYRRDAPRRHLARWILAGTLALGLAALAAMHVRDRIRWQRYLDALAAEPGIVVVEAQAGWVTHRVRGLRDELARDPMTLLAGAHVNPDSVAARWDRFLALEPSFVLARATAGVNPPAGVELSLADGVLRATGTAAPAWIAETRRVVPLLAGITGFDDAALVAGSLREAAQRLAQPRMLFAPGSARPVGNADDALAAWRATLLEIDALAALAAAPVTVEVVGHSDEVGSEDANVGLSHARAAHTLDRLDRSGLRHLSFAPVGVGSREPSAPDPTGDDRQQNRRVDMRLAAGPGVAGSGPGR